VKPAPLADENIPQTVVTGLRAAGFDSGFVVVSAAGEGQRPFNQALGCGIG